MSIVLQIALYQLREGLQVSLIVFDSAVFPFFCLVYIRWVVTKEKEIEDRDIRCGDVGLPCLVFRGERGGGVIVKKKGPLFYLSACLSLNLHDYSPNGRLH